MPRRRVFAATAVVLVALSLAACTPGGGVATPTPTELSEDEAYAQAEAAFSEYIDALNKIVVSDPATFEPAFALTTGPQNAFDRKQYSAWHATGWVKTGMLAVTLAQPSSFDEDSGRVDLDVCLNVSGAGLTDASGESQISPDRPPIVPYTVELEYYLETGYLVSDYFDRSEDPRC